jgi:hypothetical protein
VIGELRVAWLAHGLAGTESAPGGSPLLGSALCPALPAVPFSSTVVLAVEVFGGDAVVVVRGWWERKRNCLFMIAGGLLEMTESRCVAYVQDVSDTLLCVVLRREVLHFSCVCRILFS